MYNLYEIESENGQDRTKLYCTSGKEAAKFYGMYLDHSITLPRVEENGEGVKIHVSSKSSTSIYKLWRARDKIYAESIYFKSVRM